MVVTSILVAEIKYHYSWKWQPFCKWPPSASKWLIPSTETYDKIIFLQVYAPQILDIKPKLKALCLLASEIDVGEVGT